MNSKKIILLGCVAACVFAASTATAQMRGHGGSMPRMGMRGPPMSHSMGRMPMHRGPMMNSPSGFRRFGNRDFNRNDRFGRFNRFNDGRFVRNHRFHHFNHFNHFNNVVFIGDFGSRVAQLQSRLASAGYYHGAIDGIMGPATRRAIRAYERDHGYVG